VNDNISLKAAEKKSFRMLSLDGTMDIFAGCVVLQFALLPLLNRFLGSFLAWAGNIAFLALAFLAFWLFRKYVSTPRIGEVRFGLTPKTKTMRFKTYGVFLGIVLIVILEFKYGAGLGWVSKGISALIPLGVFSFMAYILEYPLLYLYGALAALSVLISEWFKFHVGLAPFGTPITYGVMGGIIVLIGLFKLVRFLHHYPVPTGEPASLEESHGG